MSLGTLWGVDPEYVFYGSYWDNVGILGWEYGRGSQKSSFLGECIENPNGPESQNPCASQLPP